jgi:ATP:ADP antiporter, AAA family
MFQVLNKLNLDQKKFILMCIGFSFLITLDYSCLRPAAHALFITQFGAKALPWAWFCSLPINFLIVAGFNKIQAHFGSKKLNLIFPVLVMALNAIFTMSLKWHPKMSFAFFLWKDLYILLMFQQLWSQIHASIGQTLGRKLYGAMYGAGAFGSLLGSSIPAILKLSTERYLSCTLFIYPFIWMIQKQLLANKEHIGFEKKAKASAMDGIKQIITSRELITIGTLVALMQMVSALSEYNFSFHLEKNFHDLASRTKASAFVMSLMHFLTLGLQIIFSIISIEKLGIKRGHKMIPTVLLFSSMIYLFLPGFKTASLGFGFAKSLDFSIFSVLKESLYAPLDKAFKYEAKSFIDIFVYRGAKTIMSLALIAFSSLHSSLFFGSLLVFLVLVWFYVASMRLKSYKIEA